MCVFMCMLSILFSVVGVGMALGRVCEQVGPGGSLSSPLKLALLTGQAQAP